MKVKISPPRRFPMHDGRANNICSYSQEHTFQIEHKRQCWNWKPRRRRARPFELSRRVITMSQTLLDKSSKIVVQYSTVQYSTVQHSTAQYSTVQHSTVQYSTAQYSTVRAQNVGPNHRSEIVQNRQIRPRPRPRPGCQDPPCRRPRAPAADVAPAGPAVAAAPAHDRAGRGGGGGGAAAAAGGHPAPPHQRALQAKSFKPLPQIQDLILWPIELEIVIIWWEEEGSDRSNSIWGLLFSSPRPSVHCAAAPGVAAEPGVVMTQCGDRKYFIVAGNKQ